MIGYVVLAALGALAAFALYRVARVVGYIVRPIPKGYRIEYEPDCHLCWKVERSGSDYPEAYADTLWGAKWAAGKLDRNTRAAARQRARADRVNGKDEK